MNISSVGGSNTPVQYVRSRPSTPQTNSTENLQAEGTSSPPPAPQVAEKLDKLTRVQQALISALRTGEAINAQGLLSPIT